MAKKSAKNDGGSSGYELIITEKPSTAAKIAEALADGKLEKHVSDKVSHYELTHDGKRIMVCSAVGHLFTVAEKEKSFNYPSYDIEWQLTADVEKDSGFSRKYAQVIKRLAKDASEFTVATDYDIEGETIGLNIIQHLCKRPDANRMKFSTVTKDELREAYADKQRHLDWGQANAGTTRHILDWFYGINISRALTASVKTAGSFMILSAGRVQGPALRIVVEREKEIRAFIPEDYWQLDIHGTKDGQAWEAIHERDRFSDEKEAKAVQAKSKGKPAIIEKVESREFQQQAPTPFDLGGLQTESYRAFGIKPKETLDIAQVLYTSAYISYPRTSSQKLPAKLGYRKILQALAKQDQYSDSARILMEKGLLTPNEGKKEDPAHPAIYPTGVIPEGLKPREEKVYDLIVKRFFATFGEAATRQTDTISIVMGGETFLCKGTRTIKKGWHALYAPYVDLSEDEPPGFREREKIEAEGPRIHKKQTQPPKRYTPASLVNELEKRGLGTKATRAEIVEALGRRDYVKGQKSIEATELGIKIYEILDKRIPEIVDEELTRHFEDELEQIRSDEKKSEEVLEEAKAELTKILGKFQKHEKETGNDLIEARQIERNVQNTLFPCKRCNQGSLKIMFSKKNKRRFIGCERYPDCDFTAPLPQMALVKPSDKECPSCGWTMLLEIRKGRPPATSCVNPDCPIKKEMEAAQQKLAKSVGEGKPCPTCGQGKLTIKNGRFGMFLSCDRYPDCKTIVNIPKSKEEAQRDEEQKLKAKDAGEGNACPNCGEGKLTLRKSARGYFLGCNKYPKCRTVVKIDG